VASARTSLPSGRLGLQLVAARASRAARGSTRLGKVRDGLVLDLPVLAVGATQQLRLVIPFHPSLPGRNTERQRPALCNLTMPNSAEETVPLTAEGQFIELVVGRACDLRCLSDVWANLSQYLVGFLGGSFRLSTRAAAPTWVAPSERLRFSSRSGQAGVGRRNTKTKEKHDERMGHPRRTCR